MSIEAKILLDSVNPCGNRITTWILKFPRFILPEFNTHRAFSRNASSSRAIPVKKMLEDVKNNPAIPTFWGKNQSGMQASEELDNVVKKYNASPFANPYSAVSEATDLEHAKFLWLQARDNAVKSVEAMMALGLHKQIANRILEPWMHITVLATATEHENFFALRAHKDAQPEFQDLAYKMLDLYQSSTPKSLGRGEWHIPFGDQFDVARLTEIAMKSSVNGFIDREIEDEVEILKLKIATARCARTSYLNFEGKDDYVKDIELHDILSNSGHWSPFEHCAEALDKSEQSGNFIGWKQYRKFFTNENRTDGRVQRQS